MENVIIHSDKVLIIMTQGYKEKADKRFAGAGYEAKLIANLIKENQHTRKFIPIKETKMIVFLISSSPWYLSICQTITYLMKNLKIFY